MIEKKVKDFEFFSQEFYDEKKDEFNKSWIFKNAFLVENYDDIFIGQKKIEDYPFEIYLEYEIFAEQIISLYKKVFSNYEGQETIIFNNFTSEFDDFVLKVILEGSTRFFPEEYKDTQIDKIIIISKENFFDLYKRNIGFTSVGYHFFLNFDRLYLDKECKYELLEYKEKIGEKHVSDSWGEHIEIEYVDKKGNKVIEIDYPSN